MIGSIPDLSALTKLETLDLSHNRLSGSFPDLSALTNLKRWSLSGNQWPTSTPTPTPTATPTPSAERVALVALYAATNGANWKRSDNWLSDAPLATWHGVTTDGSGRVVELNLTYNRLSGSLPDLGALTNLMSLNLSVNQLSGSLPDLSALTRLTSLWLDYNRLNGPIPDLSTLTNLTSLHLNRNRLSGAIPDLGALTNLTSLNLQGNRLCLPEGSGLSGSNAVVAAHLKSLNPPACAGAETPPGRPQNLTATAGNQQITLRWGAVAKAASYELRAWDSVNRRWGRIGGALTGASYTHAGVTAGRRYYYQVRAVSANGVAGLWTERVYASLTPTQLPPPPRSLGVDLFYQKYVDAGGVAVVAPFEVSDEKLLRARDVVTSMLSGRSDLLETMAATNRFRIAIYGATGIISQLPEFGTVPSSIAGTVIGDVAGVPENDQYCLYLIHEFAHLLDRALDLHPDGREFSSRLETAYRAAMKAGLWTGKYASTNVIEYWAETVAFWFSPRLFSQEKPADAANSSKLADYDAEAAKLIGDVFGAATLTSSCAP